MSNPSTATYRQDEHEAHEIARIAVSADCSYDMASDLLEIMHSNRVDLATARQYMADEQCLRDEETAARAESPASTGDIACSLCSRDLSHDLEMVESVEIYGADLICSRCTGD